MAILKGHLVEKAPISQVCDHHGFHPTVFYRWQKEFFENGAAAFAGRASKADGRGHRLEARVEKLTAKLARKDEVIAELMEDHVRLKEGSTALSRMSRW